MGAGNGGASVLDYTVMRIYQRTGENTAIGYSVWAIVIVAMLGVGLVMNAWPVALLIALLVGFLKWVEHRIGQDGRELQALQTRERMESEHSDLQRLRNKYRS